MSRPLNHRPKVNILFCSVIIIRQASPISIIIYTAKPVKETSKNASESFFWRSYFLCQKNKCSNISMFVCVCGVMKRNENSWPKINYVTGVPAGCDWVNVCVYQQISAHMSLNGIDILVIQIYVRSLSMEQTTMTRDNTSGGKNNNKHFADIQTEKSHL